MRIKWTPTLSLLLAGLAGAVLVVGVQLALRFLHHGSAGQILASVDGKPITIQTLESEMVRRGGADHFNTPELRRALLDELIRVRVLARNAELAGLTTDSEVLRGVELLLAEKYQHDRIDEPLASLEVSDGDVEEYYRTHLASYTTPESSHVAVIFVAAPPDATDEQRQGLRQRAEEIRARAAARSDGASFAELVTQYSEDPVTRSQAGDIGWVNVGQDAGPWDPALINGIFELTQPGQISAVIPTARGFYVARLTEHKPRLVRPLSELRTSLWQQLMHELKQERAEKLYAAAISNVQVSVNEASVAAMEAAEQAVVNRQPGDAPPPPG